MRKVTILAVVALAAGTVNVGIAAGPADAVALASTVSAARSFTNLHDVELCDNTANSLCMNGFDGDGGSVNSFPFTPGDAQDVSVIKLTNCGGTVTDVPACPFAAGTHLNSKFQGDPIVGITLDANGYAFRADGMGSMLESSAGSGQVWVLDGNSYVNVADSSNNGLPQFACDDGHSGHPMFVSPTLTANCVWLPLHGS
jgi:hypothetical protein